MADKAVVIPGAGRSTIERARRAQGGYLKDTDVAAMAADPETRLAMVLVRCGGGRFMCAAQDVKHFVAIIEEHATRPDSAETDYIRDVSLPAEKVNHLCGNPRCSNPAHLQVVTCA